MPFDITKAERVRDFIESLVFSRGRWAGRPFRLMDWQWEQVIKPLYATLRNDGLRQYRYCYVEIPKKTGKCLAVDTKIPTPFGWKKLADIEDNDFVFNEKGQPTRVIWASNVITGRQCFEIYFNDGTLIKTDADHKWELTQLRDRRINGKRILYHQTIKTTKEMFTNYDYKYAKRYKIKTTEPLICSEKFLHIPPYTFGAWLGDGRSNDASITCEDKDILERIKSENINVTAYKRQQNRSPAYRLGRRQYTGEVALKNKLSQINVLDNKRIPSMYLRASIQQRLELMRGLMDTDGYCSKSGQCEFTTVYPKLFDGFMELARSLGYRPTYTAKPAKLNGKEHKTAYRIRFMAFSDNPVFHLKRKTDRLKPKPEKPTRSQYRQIIKIKKINSIPVKCIAVESSSNLFLAGESMIPTHNTELAAPLALYHLCADGEGSPEVFSAAADTSQAALVYHPAAYMSRNNKVLAKRLDVRDSVKRISYKNNNGFYQVLSAEHHTKHGLSPSAIFFDELHAQPNDELWNVLTAGTDFARDQQLIMVMTTAGIWDIHSIWWKIRTKAIQIAKGIVKQDDFLPVLYIADPEKDDPEDRKLWQRVNPSLGTIFDMKKIERDFEQAKQDPVDYQNFLRFRLNIPVKSLTRWMDMTAWDTCNGPVDPAALNGRSCYGGLDLSTKIDLTAFLLVFVPDYDESDRYHIICKFYVPEDTVIERSRTDKVHYELWVEQGFITATPGDVIDYEFIFNDIVTAAADYDLAEVGFDPWNASALATRLYNDEGIDMVEMRQGSKTLSEPAKDLLVNIKQHNICHGGHPVLRWCADNLVMVTDANENVRPAKDKAVDRIDGVVALINAWGRMMKSEGDSVYEEHGVRVIE